MTTWRTRGGRIFVTFYRLRARLRAKVFSLLASGAFSSFGANSVIQPPVRLTGEDRIAIGDDVFIGAGCWLQVIGGTNVVISIGDGSSFAGNCVVSAVASVKIGARVLVARGAYIADHSHAFEDTERPVLDQGLTRIWPVEICDGAWLGENVVIAPGVRVGRGAVIGANSVVLNDVPDYCVVAGAPARILRSFLVKGLD